MKRAAPPPREQARELAGDRRQPGTAAAAAAAGRGEYLGAERMLHRTFGTSYEAYRAQVPRWL